MAKVRVMLAGMPRMMTDIIRTIITSADDFEFVGELIGTNGILSSARELAADVIILAAHGGGDRREITKVLRGGPRIIIGIEPDGRRAMLHQLSLAETSLGEISPAALIAAVRAHTQAITGCPS